jgi:CRP/FNR family transcriptional regulator, cyclic AMP receptor protein
MQVSDNVKDTEKIISLLARMPMLKMFSKEQLAQILNFTTIRVYDFGESMIEEGRSDKSFFIMISGSAYVIKNGVHIGEFKTVGDIFGEMSIIDGAVRSASVVAQDRTICLCIDASFIDSSANTQQSLLCQNIIFRAIAEILADRLRSMNEQNLELNREIAKLKSSKK